MANTPKEDSEQIFLRVFADDNGKVFLLYEPMDLSVEVTTPVSKESLEEAKTRLVRQVKGFLKAHKEQHEGIDEKTLTAQQLANRQIIKALELEPRSGFWNYVKITFGKFETGLFTLLAVVIMISVVYKGVELSQKHLPEILHIVVLALYVLGLTYCVYLMATEERLRKGLDRIKYLFGPRGLLVLPSLTLVVAASVFASLTLTLYRHGWVTLQECTGRPVAEGSLMDFYMWHFLKLVPLVKLNEVLKLGEPLCYSQKRVGALILLFQALVVLPSINTVLYYWKNRHTLSRKPIDYKYEVGWKLGEDKAESES